MHRKKANKKVWENESCVASRALSLSSFSRVFHSSSRCLSDHSIIRSSNHPIIQSVTLLDTIIELARFFHSLFSRSTVRRRRSPFLRSCKHACVPDLFDTYAVLASNPPSSKFERRGDGHFWPFPHQHASHTSSLYLHFPLLANAKYRSERQTKRVRASSNHLAQGDQSW